MEMKLSGFDASKIEATRGGSDAVPAGEYLVEIVSSEEKPTKAGTGSYLEFSFKVIEGNYQGQRFWSRLNLRNPNPVAVEIAKGELASICRAVGIATPEDSSDMHGEPLLVKVVQTTGPDGTVRNEIKGYKPCQDPATQQAPPKAAPAKPAWGKAPAKHAQTQMATPSDDMPF
jgi:hypothetical protein